MTTKTPKVFLWTPYVWWLAVIATMIVWPFIFIPLLRVDAGTMTYIAMPIWLFITLPLGVILFLVWLVRLLTHRRAERDWLATHDA